MVRSSSRSLQARFGARLQTLRRERDLTQEEIAQKSGISQKYLSELERGEKVPSWETLASLAHNGFEIKLASLFFGIDDEEAAAAKYLEDILAGRPEHVRYDVLQAVQLLLQAGERGRTKRK